MADRVEDESKGAAAADVENQVDPGVTGEPDEHPTEPNATTEHAELEKEPVEGDAAVSKPDGADPESTEPRGQQESDSRAAPPKTLLPSPMVLDLPPTTTIEDITQSHAPDSPTISLIASLRTQLTELSDQTNALNTKLIEAISRHADLEDTHIALQTRHSELEERARSLAADKARWEDSMNTGLLVERSQIKDEMQRLAAGLVEEERRRGSAEVRRQKVEEEVDELAASLFDQANTMVATERMARNTAETRLKETEDNLAAAESAMRDMQLHLQSLPAASTSPPSGTVTNPRRYLSSHMPYTEFLSFLSHLRSLRPLKETSKAIFPPPSITTLLAQPFVARTITEDHDPTIRLDAAPDLSYFSRRTVGPAIIAGELIVEPVSANTVITATTGAPHDISCSLCGKPVFPFAQPSSPSTSHFGPPPLHPTQKQSRFSLKPFFNATSPSAAASPSQSPLASPVPASGGSSFAPVYVFHVQTTKASGSTAGTGEKETKVYPLCRTGWCLERLRAACELWHFVRTGVIQPVWHGDDGYVLAAEQAANTDDVPTPRRSSSRLASVGRRVSNGSVGGTASPAGDAGPPPLPERKKSGGWGLGFKLGSGSTDKPAQGSGWFGRSGSATPPKTPTDLPSTAEGLVASSTEMGASADGDRKLEAPIDLEQKIDEEKVEGGDQAVLESEESTQNVPRIERHDASPTAPEPVSVEGELAAADRGEGSEQNEQSEQSEPLRPTVVRTASNHSMATSAGGTEEGTFSTPKGQAHDLPDEHESDQPANAEPVEQPSGTTNDEAQSEAEEIEVDTQPAPVVDLTESAQASPSLGAPPPIPKRSANRLSRVIDPEGGPSRDENSTPVSPVPPVSEEVGDAVAPAETEMQTAAGGDGAEQSASLAPVRAVAPPPLPPRHPVTPSNPVHPDPLVEGEKRWMKHESDVWEEKTWRTILKLKEEMWKARVGVSDEIDG